MRFVAVIILLTCCFQYPMTCCVQYPMKQQEVMDEEDKELLIMFWNLENFFDYKDNGTGESDKEFSPSGSRHWTRKRFYTKCRAIAKSILWIAGQEGRLPDIIGVAEIENRFVLEKLIESTALRKLDYGIIHYDSPDHRGIDVGMLYRKDRLKLISSKPFRVIGVSETDPKDSLHTRDILLAQFQAIARLNVLVNHHPSKFGGAASEWKRAAAIRRLKAITDSLYASGEKYIIATGDFNDTPENPVFEHLCNNSLSDGSSGCKLINKALPLALKGKGTIRFNGKWQLIDMYFVTPELEASEMKTVTLPFLVKWDNVHPGEKPLRTYSGPKYLAGVSDHLPIVLRLSFSPFPIIKK